MDIIATEVIRQAVFSPYPDSYQSTQLEATSRKVIRTSKFKPFILAREIADFNIYCSARWINKSLGLHAYQSWHTVVELTE